MRMYFFYIFFHMIALHQLLWLALLTCCRGAASALDGKASSRIPDQAKEVDAPDSGFVDYDASDTILDGSGFSYLDTNTYGVLKEKLQESISLPNEKLLPHLTEKFVTLHEPDENLPERFREVHIGADKDLMNGVKLYRSSGISTEWDRRRFLLDTRFLEDHNIQNIINLSELELSPKSQLLLQNADIQVTHIKITDFEAPTSEQLKTAIMSIEKARHAGVSTLVFCGYGDGRTGTVVAAYELWKIFHAYPDLSTDEILTYVMRRNGYVKVAHGMMPSEDVEHLVNTYNTHKIEYVEQVDALLKFAGELSEELCIFIV